MISAFLFQLKLISPNKLKNAETELKIHLQKK